MSKTAANVTAATVVLAAIRERVAALHAVLEPGTDPEPTGASVDAPETDEPEVSDGADDDGTSVTVPATEAETPDDDTPGESHDEGDGGTSVTLPAAADEIPGSDGGQAGDAELPGGGTVEIDALAEALADLDAVVSGFAPLVEGAEIVALRAELAWARAVADDAHGLEGTVDVITDLVDDLEPALKQGPVEERLGLVVTTRTAERRDAVTAMLAQPEWASLVAHADRIVLTAPIAGGKPKNTVKILARALSQADAAAREAADTAVAEAHESDAGVPRLAPVISAAETVATTAAVTRPVLGKQARKLADAAAAMATALAERRRTESAARWLVDLADIAHRAGEPSFTYGVLHTEARARRTKADEALAAAVAAYTKPKLHKWLSAL